VDTSADLSMIMAEAANCTVTARLAGVAVATFRGIFDEKAEPVQPYESERLMLRPVVTVLTGDLAGIDSSHALEITRDGGLQGQSYTFDGKPSPDGEGLTLVALAVKK
jgi:hypothetical protein